MSGGPNDKYILDAKGEPVQCSDIKLWAAFMGDDAARTVAKETIGKSIVSTVFIGFNSTFMPGDPVLYETLIIGGAKDGECKRYKTKAEALAGHDEMVKAVKG